MAIVRLGQSSRPSSRASGRRALAVNEPNINFHVESRPRSDVGRPRSSARKVPRRPEVLSIPRPTRTGRALHRHVSHPPGAGPTARLETASCSEAIDSSQSRPARIFVIGNEESHDFSSRDRRTSCGTKGQGGGKRGSAVAPPQERATGRRVCSSLLSFSGRGPRRPHSRRSFDFAARIVPPSFAELRKGVGRCKRRVIYARIARRWL